MLKSLSKHFTTMPCIANSRHLNSHYRTAKMVPIMPIIHWAICKICKKWTPRNFPLYSLIILLYHTHLWNSCTYSYYTHLFNVFELGVCLGLILGEQYAVPRRPVLPLLPARQRQLKHVPHRTQRTLTSPDVLHEIVKVWLLQ